MFFEAIFQPEKLKEYNSNVRSLVGKNIPIVEGWIIKEGPHEGQHCFYIPNSTVGVIPACDLKEIKPVSNAKWKEMHNSLELENL